MSTIPRIVANAGPAGPSETDSGYPTSDLSVVIGAVRNMESQLAYGLEQALQAMAAGDFTQSVAADQNHLLIPGADAELRALVDLVNSLQTRLLCAADAYETLRGDLLHALGEQSCLPELLEGLQSLNAHCLTDLDTGLQGMADGDFTRSARPVTHPLRSAPGNVLGEVGDVFNEMLARSRTALRSYEAVREDLRSMLGDRSSLDELRRGLRSLQRHCLRDLEEALEALSEGTALTRPIAPVTSPIAVDGDQFAGELAPLFNRALSRAQSAVRHLSAARNRSAP